MEKKNIKLVFYAPSTITVIAGQGEKKQASIRYAFKKSFKMKKMGKVQIIFIKLIWNQYFLEL